MSLDSFPHFYVAHPGLYREDSRAGLTDYNERNVAEKEYFGEAGRETRVGLSSQFLWRRIP